MPPLKKAFFLEAAAAATIQRYAQSPKQNLLIALPVRLKSVKMTMEVETDNEIDMQMSSAATTIDPSVIQSRILLSASLQQVDTAAMDESDQPVFPQISAAQANGNRVEYRRVRCPPHRYTPLREHWEQILTPLVEYLKLQVRSSEPLVVFKWAGRVATRQMMR